ncbi:hypothetical protein GCM10022243_24890 [Saccharothrix violaceirubra]
MQWDAPTSSGSAAAYVGTAMLAEAEPGANPVASNATPTAAARARRSRGTGDLQVLGWRGARASARRRSGHWCRTVATPDEPDKLNRA